MRAAFDLKQLPKRAVREARGSTRGCGSSDRIRVSRTRVLRVMRTQGLLSPHRGRQGEMKVHEGTIVTSAPYLMWGTDGVRVFTPTSRTFRHGPFPAFPQKNGSPASRSSLTCAMTGTVQ